MSGLAGEHSALFVGGVHKNHRQRLVVVHGAKLLLCIALLAWLIASGRLDLTRVASVSIGFHLLLTVVCLIASMALPALRWWWLLRIQGIRKPLGEIARLTWIGYFANNFLPGGAGGDLAKAYLIVCGRSSLRLRAVSTVVVDRLIGLFSLLLLSCGSLAWLEFHDALTPAMTPIAVCTLAVAAGILAMPSIVAWRPARALFAAILPRRMQQLVRHLRDAWHLYRYNPLAMLGCLMISLMSNSLVMISLAAAATALRFETSPVTVFLIAPIIVVANCIPLTPGGAGIGEAAGERLFGLFGLVGGSEVILLTRIIMVLVSVPAGLVLKNTDRWQKKGPV